jgi:hypothetical protein
MMDISTLSLLLKLYPRQSSSQINVSPCIEAIELLEIINKNINKNILNITYASIFY